MPLLRGRCSVFHFNLRHLTHRLFKTVHVVYGVYGQNDAVLHGPSRLGGCFAYSLPVVVTGVPIELLVNIVW